MHGQRRKDWRRHAEKTLRRQADKILLFPHLNVEQNVGLGLSGARCEHEWLEKLRERFNLGAIWRATATAISGGQAQRVALARTFARRPAPVLLDEPFAGLDRIVTREFIATLKIWQRNRKFASSSWIIKRT